jgi:hypothetical protein
MASSLFDKGREGFLSGDLDWDANDIRVMLVKSTYSYDATDVYVSALSTKYTTSGIADAADITLTATAAVACNALVIFKHTGADTSARLIAYIDTATGLPLTPATSATVSISWANTTNRIFKL